MIEYAMKLTQAEVLLEIDDILSNHDRIFNIGLNPFQALDALVTSVPGMRSISIEKEKLTRRRELMEIFDLKLESHSLPSSIAGAPSLANMDGSINKVVLNNGKLQILTKIDNNGKLKKKIRKINLHRTRKQNSSIKVTSMPT